MKNTIRYITSISISCLLLIAHESLGIEQKNDNKSDIANPAIDQPIALQGTVEYDQVKNQQQDYIRKHYEDYEVYGFSNTLPKDKNGRFIQTFYLANDQGEEVKISFDATDAYNARNRKGNEELKKLVKKKEEDRKKAKNTGSKFDALTKSDWEEIKKPVDDLVAEELKKSGKTFENLPQEEKDRITQLAINLVNELANKKLAAKTSGK